MLRASEWGGALEVQRSSHQRLSKDEALPVGSHVLEVRSLVDRAPTPPAQVWPFEIRRGELTKVDLSSGVLE
ncbi:hypothetical protein [Planctomycetes bacterium Poly30]|uniref:hypothetical protein n=1 Tax=Saltatorellus ferox TaxID=2528018 RepID=UPI00119FF683